MPAFEQVAWFPLCAGLTGVGLAAAWLAWRRRGAAAGLRLAGWSLLPLAMYLVGAVEMLWTMVTAAVGWAVGFAVSPAVWAGVCLVGLAAVAFAVSGRLRSRRAATPTLGQDRAGRSASGDSITGTPRTSNTLTSAAPARSDSSAEAPSGDGSVVGGEEDFSDVEEILRRRGIR